MFLTIENPTKDEADAFTSQAKWEQSIKFPAFVLLRLMDRSYIVEVWSGLLRDRDGSIIFSMQKKCVSLRSNVFESDNEQKELEILAADYLLNKELGNISEHWIYDPTKIVLNFDKIYLIPTLEDYPYDSQTDYISLECLTRTEFVKRFIFPDFHPFFI